MVDAASKIAANERHHGETMLEFPDQQHADRHFAPENCVLGCTKVTLTWNCSNSRTFVGEHRKKLCCAMRARARRRTLPERWLNGSADDEPRSSQGYSP